MNNILKGTKTILNNINISLNALHKGIYKHYFFNVI